MVKFRMTGVTINQFAILADEYKRYKEWQADVDLVTSYAVETSEIAIRMKFLFRHLDSKILVLEITCRFKIDGTDKFEVKDGHIIIPANFVAHLAMHTVGTARGVLVCKTEGTPYSQYILPPINVSSMIPNDIEVPSVSDNTVGTEKSSPTL